MCLTFFAALVSSMIVATSSQQTFQNTIFDLPAQLGGEPVGVAAQAQGAPLFVQQPDQAPPAAVPNSVLPTAAPAVATAAPLFTFPTLPTVAPFTLPTVTPPTFTLPTHPPFSFPTHPPLVFTTPAPYLPPSPYAFVPQQPQQQYYNGYPQQYYQPQQVAYQQSQQPQPQPQYNNGGGYNYNYNYYNNQAPPAQGGAPQQQQQQAASSQINGQQTVAQSFEKNTQIVQPVRAVQSNARVVEPTAQKLTPVVNAVATKIVDTDSSSKKAVEFNKANTNIAKISSAQKVTLDAEIDANIDRHLWFSPEYDVKQCRQSLNGIGIRFQKKFPSYLQKGGKDRELAELVEQRLLECERKSTASHWDRVDQLLQKIKLTKSEEGECRAGLIQERISCVNLLKFACQFVDSSYHFKLVPARITIQEARQAESGAEKCRQVIRIVKQRLESGAVTL